MLKYFSRQKSRRSHIDDANSSSDVHNSLKRNSLRSTSSFCDEIFFESDADATKECGMNFNGIVANMVHEEFFISQSRLSMSLPAIVADQNCLSYFVQYLESKNALPLIKFYLDTENFRTAALAQIEIEEKFIKISELENVQSAEEKLELEKNEQKRNLCNVVDETESSVPELKTLCDISMRKPLTDDEKSQIYAETNKQITKCNAFTSIKIKSNSELSLCSEEGSIDDLNTEDNAICPTTSIKNGYVTAASIKDAIAIYQKYLILKSQQFVSLPVTILSHISLLLCKREDEKESDEYVDCRPISANCFLEAQHYVLEQLENNFLLDFLQSTFYCKYCIELIENANNGLGSTLTIFDILYSEATLFFFMEFLEQEQERNCLDFWTAAINYRKSYVEEISRFFTAPTALLKTENLAQADAMIIYEKYFSLQSEHRLWLSDKLRCKVEESICAVGKVAKCFDLPLHVIAKYLEKKYLQKFLNSKLFAYYLNELKLKICESTLSNVDVTSQCSAANIVYTNIENTKSSRHRKTLSDCTNASSRALLKNISQQNTLLAMESHTNNNLKLQGSTSLSIDSRQLTNPKMLWKRSSSTEGGLKFGRVNSLGRYERDFDDVDAAYGTHKNSWSLTMGSNKIKNAMRKLVNLPEDKVQEEIAWQVAEMIIKDVTSITLCDEKQNRINKKQ